MKFLKDALNMLKVYELELVDIVDLNQNAYSFQFIKPSDVDFRAGQHFMFHLPYENSDSRGERRIFSISSAPEEELLVFSTRYYGKESSTFKQALMDMKPGDKIKSRGPSPLMDFYNVSDKSKEYILIAGGIGITPARSVIVQSALTEKKLKGKLVYADSKSELIFEDDLKSAIAELEEFNMKKIIKPKRIDEDLIENLKSEFPDAVYIISGSPSFTSSIKELLQKSEVDNIKTYKYISIPFMGGGY